MKKRFFTLALLATVAVGGAAAMTGKIQALNTYYTASGVPVNCDTEITEVECSVFSPLYSTSNPSTRILISPEELEGQYYQN